ncbi:MAG: zinc ribbon domain-containing protein [Planctomycetota bacterium]|nr:zinc ribbon domain-containing protein [Planctomycetota bacterium]
MPTYDYVCDACGHEFEVFESIKADPQKICPKCEKASLRRKIGGGAAIIFKGSGFYQTDYRSESYKKAAEADKSASSAAPAKSESAGAAAASPVPSAPAASTPASTTSSPAGGSST